MKDLSVSPSALVQAAEVLLRIARTTPTTPSSIPQLDSFIADHCHDAPGSMIRFSEFFERFVSTLPDRESVIEQRLKHKVIAALKLPYGRYHNNQRYIGNIAWSKPTQKPTRRMVAVSGRLKAVRL